MQAKLLKGIQNHLITTDATRLLWVSAEPGDIPADLRCIHCLPDLQALSALGDDHYDYAILVNPGLALGKTDTESLLAKLRDVSAQRVFWLVNADEPWHTKDALALGFRLLEEGEAETLYGFDIDNYKTTPDWLNAKHWANPERWNKDRW